ncbi:LysE family transporter [Desulfofustis glycolicus]|uniref:Threonine/homoserine/homoserine lactone efflux protein n=1 Tax=Desulfofustis glycolicus DSM 9705 TaxID=1121409 RepID=A0A1M5XVL5_9BACT|nr:LysE family transporter [Desulfofustis glycolicus]MCB2217191.1 LysE family translocator [Desulfobulbaceae bacterium]SHI03568.1 Threonine/homoserine/homoserine lactone efflux protein [Desulfofustis glycolicus DSM 9705]
MSLALISISLSSFVIALSGAMMPGPVMTVTVSESVRRGATVGPLMILGHGLLELLLVGALITGLAPLLSRDEVFIAISLVGGVILLWMAVSMFKGLPSLHLCLEDQGKRSRNLILAGILLSIANPYWLLWWATIGLGYIVYSMQFGLIGVAAFFVGHILADLTWYGFISFGIARGRRFFTDSRYRLLVGICASFLVLFSGYFIVSGIERLI